MPNRLAAETSPYLLQHQDNPVDWYPWGAEAFAEARRRDQPILLSVGYSSCHWCHVMAHESFEDPGTAELMNRLFVNVKVDREERPDVDSVYMDALQRMTGRGGWPMTVFLTPEGRPFYAGTYFPRDDRPGLPSFQRVMAALGHAWAERRAELVDQADRLVGAIDQRLPAGDRLPDREVLSTALEAVRSAHDPEYGGFGGAPKFPQEPLLEFLLRVEGEPWAEGAAHMARAAMEGMARGGIYDHVGGGFARYSVDRRWLIPHFEKMLYTNAQLARLYLRGWQVTGEVRFRRVAVETLDYLLRDLMLPGGGFASSEDADSEGVEGKFYVFDHGEFGDIVGPEAKQVAAAYFGVTREGNFESANHLHEARTATQVAADLGVSQTEVEAAIELARSRLFEARSRRVRPALDDKVIASWNGMTIRALAEAGAVLAEHRYLEAACGAAGFILEHLRRPDGRLLRSWGKGRPGPDGFCDDHASLAIGLLTLYQATADPEWFEEAMVLVEAMVDLFSDPDGGFFTTGRDAEALVIRPKDHQDGAHPSANSLAAEALLLAALYTGDAELHRLAEGTIRAGGRLMEVAPTGAGHLLAVLHSLRLPPREVAVVGPEANRLASVVWERFRPDVALAVDRDGSGGEVVPLLEGRAAGDRTLAFVCRDFVCELPVSSPEELRNQLGP